MPNPIVVTSTSTVTLESSPISSDWILAGMPKARSKMLSKSRDGTTRIVAWDCSPGEFVWHYAEDETVVVLSGEAFITNDAGEECRLAEGHVAFFPGGTSSKWRVTRPITKVALLRKDLPRPLGFGVRVWHLLLRLSGLRGGSQLVPAAGNAPLSHVVSEAHSS
jgi:uncharacterized protein